MIIAVDFDGTIVEDCFPYIGKPLVGFTKRTLLEELKLLQKSGHEIILWTCRCGEHLKEAEEFCAENGLVFDAVNDDLERVKERFAYKMELWKKSGKARKILADIYIDDRGLNNGTVPSNLCTYLRALLDGESLKE